MNEQTPVAVASRSFSRHPVLRAELLQRYARVTFNDAGVVLQDEALIAFLCGHVKAITALERLDARVLAALPELRVISKYGVGLDMIDIAAMERHGIALGWTPGVNRRSVAELVLCFMIALTHRLPEATTLLKEANWRHVVGHELSQRTVGIVGCGHVGQDLARLLRAFGCRVLAHDVRDYCEFYSDNGIQPVTLETLLRNSDVVTLHLPLDDSTRNILSADRLALMKAGSVLINTARGGLVDEMCVKRLLMDGRLAGAAFDVFAMEPPCDLDLIRLPNFIATPHLGGSTEEAILAMGRAAIEGLDKAVPVVRAVFQQLVSPGLRTADEPRRGESLDRVCSS